MPITTTVSIVYVVIISCNCTYSSPCFEKYFFEKIYINHFTRPRNNNRCIMIELICLQHYIPISVILGVFNAYLFIMFMDYKI